MGDGKASFYLYTEVDIFKPPLKANPIQVPKHLHLMWRRNDLLSAKPLDWSSFKINIFSRNKHDDNPC